MRQWPNDRQLDFYKKARAMSCEDIKALAKREIHAEKQDFQEYWENGVFLPLSVWVTKGWPEANIRDNSLPEDIRCSKKYGWVTYRVPIEMDRQGESHSTSDKLHFTAKRKTKALKRRRTEESSPARASEPESSFSSEESGDTEERTKKRKSRAQAKGKGKAKSKAAPKALNKHIKKYKINIKKKTHTQAPKLNKAQREASSKAKKLQSKVATLLNKLKGTTKHDSIIDVEDEILAAAKAQIKEVALLSTRLLAVAETGVDDGIVQEVADLDAKSYNPVNDNLKKALKKLLTRPQ